MAIALIALMLLVTLMRVYLPKGSRRSGKVLKDIRLDLREKFLMQRVNLYCLGLVLFLMIVTDSITSPVLLGAVVAAQVILMLPVRCTLTSTGVGVSNVVFRPWSEFTGFRVSARQIVLVGHEGTRPLNLHFLVDHQKEVVPTLRRYLQEIKAREEGRPGVGVTVS